MNDLGRGICKKLIDAGVPRLLAECACGTPSETNVLDHARKARSGRPFVVLAGPIGVGKSVAAAVLAREFIEKHGGGWVIWRHAGELARIGHFDEERAKAREQCDLLVVDDLGTEFLDNNSWLAAQLEVLFYQRHGNRRLTVVTTNLTALQFRERYSPRLVDRIRELGAFVETGGESLREPAAGSAHG